MKRTVIAGMIFLLPSLTALSQDDHFNVGLGIATKKNLRVNSTISDNEGGQVTSYFPAVSFRWGAFTLRGFEATLSMTQQPSFMDMGLLAQYTGDEYRTDEIARRKRSIFGGAYLRLLFLKVKFVQDLQGESKGNITEISLGVPIPITKSWRMIPSIGSKFFDKKYVDYYYGVKSHEVGDFKQYDGKASEQRFIGLTNMLILGKSLSIRLSATYNKYGEEIKNSPTMKDDEFMAGSFMISYKFSI